MSRSLGLTAALLVCASSAADGSTWAARPAPDLYALSAANQLVGATASGRVVVRRQLAAARRATSPSPRLALDGGRLFVLVRRDTTPDRLVVLDAVTARVIVWRRLPQGFRARVLIARDGRVFIAGNRRTRRVAPGLFEEDSLVLEADRIGRVLRSFTVRAANGHDWWVTSAALSPDGRRLAVSYHGGCDGQAPNLCTGGADVVDLTQGERQPCVEPYAGSGCVEAHGHVEFYDDSLLVAMGGEEIRLVGRTTLNTRLGNSHVMDFALDRSRRELVAAGPCQHLGGLSILNLDSGAASVIVAPARSSTPRLPTRRVCGSRVALLPSLILVAPISTAAAEPRGAGRILLVDRGTGRVRARVSLRGEPVDVLATRSGRAAAQRLTTTSQSPNGEIRSIRSALTTSRPPWHRIASTRPSRARIRSSPASAQAVSAFRGTVGRQQGRRQPSERSRLDGSRASIRSSPTFPARKSRPAPPTRRSLPGPP